MALTAIVQVGLEPTQLPVGSNGTTVFNSSNQSIWVSDEATVTPTTGVQIPAASSIIFPSGPLYAITTGAVCKVEIILAPTPFTPSAVTVTGSADVNVQNTPAVTVESGTIDVGTLPDVTIANATLNVSGTVDVGTLPDVNLASGTTVDATITNATLNVTGSTVDLASGTTIDLASGTSVDANITNATLTVETSGTTDVNVTNATVPVSGSITASIDGPVAVGSGTIYIVNPFTGESLPSPTTSTTTGNATLSATDYNLVSWDAVPLPAGSAGNLVYDSNLTNAIASVGPTWTPQNGATIGTGNGDFNVLNPGTDSAEWVLYGTGAAEPSALIGFSSAVIDVIPGETYSVSALLDATNATAGSIYLHVMTPDLATQIGYMSQNAGGSSVQQSVIRPVPAGVTQLVVLPNAYGVTVPAGDTVSWSQIQLTETSAVEPYEPGPLWTYPVYGRGGYLGETTALAFEDTGGSVDTTKQPPTFNSTYPQLATPAAPTVTVEGTAGSTTYDYQVTVKTDNASAGATRLAPSPGTNIGTIDISPGATVEIAAGSAQIGTVDLASGASVDANITNATLDITGSTVDVSGATQSSATFGSTDASVSTNFSNKIQNSILLAGQTTFIPLIPANSSNTYYLHEYSIGMAGSTGKYLAYLASDNAGTITQFGPIVYSDTNANNLSFRFGGLALANNIPINLYFEYYSNPLCYIANNSLGLVTAIDLDTESVLTTIEVATTPTGISITPNGLFAYVSDFGSSDISVIATSDNTVTNTITVGTNPFGVAITPNGLYVYVANNGSANVSVINTLTNTVGTTISVDTGPMGIAITPDGAYAYVVNNGSDSVSVIDISSNSVSTTISVGTSPAFIAITPDGSYAYVSNNGVDTISVIDISSNTVSTTITVGNGPYGVAASPDGLYIYVVNSSDGTVSVIDTSTNTVSTTITVGGTPDYVVVQPNGFTIYVTNSGTISVIDASNNTITNTITIGSALAQIALGSAPIVINSGASLLVGQS